MRNWKRSVAGVAVAILAPAAWAQAPAQTGAQPGAQTAPAPPPPPPPQAAPAAPAAPAAATAPATPGRALLSPKEALELYQRVVDLIESTAVAVPGLARASAPVLEETRQSLRAIRETSQQKSDLVFVFLTNARSYMALSDSVPKPYPFAEAAQRQFNELRVAIDRVDTHFRALLTQKEAQLRAPDRDNIRRYAEANQKLGPASPEKPRVVFLGDSITDGWRLNEYFGDRDFVNRGISGQITGEMLGRMKEDVINLRPRAMLVLAGTNDIARGVDLRTIEDNLSMIADLATFHNIHPLFASVLPISDYHRDVNPTFAQSKVRPPNTIRQLNDWLQAMCEQRHFVYVDYYSAMVDQSGWMPSDMADDGLHPNAKGYRVMAPVALAAIDKITARPAPPPPPVRPVKERPEKPAKTTQVKPVKQPKPVKTAVQPVKPAAEPDTAAQSDQPPKKKKNPFSIFTRSTAPPEDQPPKPQQQ